LAGLKGGVWLRARTRHGNTQRFHFITESKNCGLASEKGAREEHFRLTARDRGPPLGASRHNFKQSEEIVNKTNAQSISKMMKIVCRMPCVESRDFRGPPKKLAGAPRRQFFVGNYLLVEMQRVHTCQNVLRATRLLRAQQVIRTDHVIWNFCAICRHLSPCSWLCQTKL